MKSTFFCKMIYLKVALQGDCEERSEESFLFLSTPIEASALYLICLVANT